jgi:alpha-L-glutamate ligase-like protein
VMCMMRMPTRLSDGRANLHQGAVGIGVDLVSGTAIHAMLRGRRIEKSPDTGLPILGLVLPEFDRVLRTAVAAADQTGLGYVGADVVLDAKLGPVVLELNARPGLAIQLANRTGLLPRLDAVDARLGPKGAPPAELTLDERIQLGRSIAARLSR